MKRLLPLLLFCLLFAVLVPVRLFGQGNRAVTSTNLGDVRKDGRAATLSAPFTPSLSPDNHPLAADLNREPTAPSDLGDWDNGAALACIFSLGPVLNASTVASILAKPPPADYPPSAAAFMANLGLKFCAPYVEPPPDLVRDQSNCYAAFTQYDMSGRYSNIMGFPSPFSDILPGTDWGEVGTPEVLHWSTDVDVSARHPGNEGDSQVSFKTGVNPVVWRGETLLHPMDLVFIYIPGLGQERETLRAALSASKFLLDKSLRAIIEAQPNPHGIYNEETQLIAVTDFVQPTISTSMQNVTVEAIEPGGVSKNLYMGALKETITIGDNCDDHPELMAHDAPNFAAVGETYTIEWEVRDHGPHGLSGGYNSRLLDQTLTVVDTKPPIILAPPPIVTETATLPAPIDMGHPAVFDLADLEPAISHDACSQPGVACNGDSVRFPAGQTTVTWTAVDQSNNSATATQLANVKSPGSNHAPNAHNQTGANAQEAISYEPITLTLTAQDSDSDPLWFKIDDRPDDGFFHAPLLPYFIQDYRLANVSEIDFSDYCADPDNRQQYIPTNWPVDASFMAVDDAGNTYVHDKGMVWCDQFGHTDSDYRLAIFRPDGSWEQVTSSFDVKHIHVDQRNGFIYTTSTNVGNTFTWVRKFDLDLNQVGAYRIDYADIPLPNGARAGLGDEQGILYVTDGFQHTGASKLYLYDGRDPDSGGSVGDLVRLADYSLSGVNWIDLALDSQGNLYASSNGAKGHRIYKFSPATLTEDGAFTAGQLIGWLGKCDFGPGCDIEHGRSFGFSCNDQTCGLNSGSAVWGSGPGQFNLPRGIALDPNDILYVTDYNNLRVQRFTPEGYFAGQAISESDGSSFVLGDFGHPEQVTVNSNHFYVLDDGADLLHVFETTPLTHIADNAATIAYQSDNNFVGTDSFTFKVTDGLDESAPARVDINVSRNFRPPQADRGLTFTAAEDIPLPITLTGYDPDEHLDTLNFQVDTPPAYGTVSGSEPNRVYTPDPDFVGVDTFTFVANDGTFLSEPQMVTVTVTAVNDAPRFPEENQNFAFRLSGQFFDASRLSSLDNMQVGRGYSTLFKIDFYDPDVPDMHTVTIDWGDGSPVEPEGEILDDGTVTGPLLAEGNGGVPGSVTAEHIFSQNGTYSVEVCLTDNVIVNADGDKETTSESVTRCDHIPVTVAPMTDILLDIEPSSSPTPLGATLAYTLTLTNNAPDTGAGLAATGPVISDTLDSRTNFSFVSTNDGNCSQANGVVTCDMNTLGSDETAVVVIGVTLDDELAPGDRLQNQAEYSLNEANQSGTQLALETTTVVTPADFIVNTIADEPDAYVNDNRCRTADGRCSLRAAIEQANSLPGLQSVALGNQRYLLDTELVIADDLAITGLGADNSILAGNGNARVMSISNGPDVTLAGLTLMGGQATESGAPGGGGLYNLDGNVVLDGVLVSENRAEGSGGGIWNRANLTLINSAVTGNDSANGAGGGILNEGELTLTNVTISGNMANSGGGITGFGEATLTNVTISGNYASSSGGGLNGGPDNFTLQNTILAENTAGNAGPNCGYGFTSQGHNLIDDLTDCTVTGTTATNIVAQAAGLTPLAQNGAHTPTVGVVGGSPAIDNGVCLLASDQRGVLRPADGNLDNDPACDIGAFEFEPDQLYLPFMLSRR